MFLSFCVFCWPGSVWTETAVAWVWLQSLVRLFKGLYLAEKLNPLTIHCKDSNFDNSLWFYHNRNKKEFLRRLQYLVYSTCYRAYGIRQPLGGVLDTWEV